MEPAQTLDRLFDFLRAGVTPWHAVAQAARWLEEAGYTRLEESDYWNLAPGGRYYVTRNGSSIVAWRVPEHAIGGWRMTISHSDNPGWRLKPAKSTAAGCERLPVEGYGGMIMPTWLDRPLGVAGRVLVRTEDGLDTRLVDIHRPVAVIPSLCIHFDRSCNSGHTYNAQVDMQPLYGPEGCKPIRTLVAEALGLPEEDMVDSELLLTTLQEPVRTGPDGEYYLSPRIDDLGCAAATLMGFLDADADCDSACAPVWAMLDNEEVGSSTRQGAQSSFVRDLFDRILDAIPHSGQGMARALANSFCLSADNAHATHPNFPEKSDPASPVRLGGGVVVKYNATQKYSTTAYSGAVFGEICRMAGVPVQRFANRADVPGGSTLGNLQANTVPVPTVDIGLPQLAMHSAVETAACADADAMRKAVGAFYRAHIRTLGDGRCTLEQTARTE
ncbi:M18 family aminopeptidase [Subdoligranulum sp. DSM 109015]|uniref:M18 family aminopeptidase n=1 Tax=Gemmiger gallinarum TaxID=2779354 RepID=A0ABR9R462_9FIRM|nr:M18 family aminopeptidase [Gemmiger gallinarum]MBE5037940.1 M18 family aminopeptidase [Gemmiger gallinarum]